MVVVVVEVHVVVVVVVEVGGNGDAVPVVMEVVVMVMVMVLVKLVVEMGVVVGGCGGAVPNTQFFLLSLLICSYYSVLNSLMQCDIHVVFLNAVYIAQVLGHVVGTSFHLQKQNYCLT